MNLQALVNLCGDYFPPPLSFTQASSWSWIDHPGSISSDNRPMKTRFRYGSGSLNQATAVAGSFFNRHPGYTRPPYGRLPLLGSSRFHVLFHSPIGLGRKQRKEHEDVVASEARFATELNRKAEEERNRKEA